MLSESWLLYWALLMLALGIAGCGGQGGESSGASTGSGASKEILGVQAFEGGRGTAPIVSLRARSRQSAEAGSYAVTMSVLRAPCAGLIDFSAGGENLATGDSSTYVARFKLSQPRMSPGSACGTPVPDSPSGKGVARMFNDRRELLTLDVHRASRSSFRGHLYLLGLPYCEPNLLVVTLLLDGEWQRYEYVAELEHLIQLAQGAREAWTLQC